MMHIGKEEALKAILEGCKEWEENILPRRQYKLRKLAEVRSEWKRVWEDYEQGETKLNQLIALEDDENKMVAELIPEEESWKNQHRLFVTKDWWTKLHYPIAFFPGGTAQHDFSLIGWVGDALKSQPPPEPEEKEEVESIKPDKKYL